MMTWTAFWRTRAYPPYVPVHTETDTDVVHMIDVVTTHLLVPFAIETGGILGEAIKFLKHVVPVEEDVPLGP